jgi:hypothetical protein
MKTLLIAVGGFFFILGGALVYFAASGAGHEYELKLALPIDARQMPNPVAPPEVVSRTGDAGAPVAVTDGRAETGSLPPMVERPLVRLGGRSGVASEAPPQD